MASDDTKLDKLIRSVDELKKQAVLDSKKLDKIQKQMADMQKPMKDVQKQLKSMHKQVRGVQKQVGTLWMQAGDIALGIKKDISKQIIPEVQKCFRSKIKKIRKFKKKSRR